MQSGQGSGSRSRQNCNFFVLLGGAGDTCIDNSISMLNYCDGPYLDLGIYARKDRSAWTEVWTAPWSSRASVMAPGGFVIWAILQVLAGW